MADVNALIKDPKFWELGQQAQIKVMGRIDPRFADLSLDAKNKVLMKLTPKTQIPEAPPEPEGIPLSREIARVGGGLVGGLATAPGLVTTPVGVAVGAGAGEAAWQLGQHAFGLEGAPKTSKEAAKAIGWAGIREGGLEFAGGGLTRVGMKALAPFKKAVSPEVERLSLWMKDKIKPVFLPAEATESKFLDVMQNITEGSILGGMKFEKFKATRKDVFADIADDVIGMFGKQIGPDEVGELFVDAIGQRNKAFKSVASALYNDVDELAKGAAIKTDSLKSFAEPLRELGEELSGMEAANAGDDLIKAVMELPDNLTYTSAKELRSRLLSKIDEFNIINKKAPAIGKAKKLVGLIDKEIEKSLSGDALTAWRRANAFYKTQSEKFNSTLIRRLVKKGEENPQAISRAIFKPNNFKTISKVKATLTPKEWESMQSYLMQDLLLQATKEASTDASGKIIEATLMGQRLIDQLVGKRTGIGMKSLKQIFSPEQLKEIFNFSNALKVAQKKQGEGLGRMYIQLAQGSMAVTVAAAGFGMLGGAGDVSPATLAGAGLIVFGPAVLSRMMLKPGVIRYLTKGLSLPVHSPEVVGIVTRLLAASRRINLDMLEEGKGENRTTPLPPLITK